MSSDEEVDILGRIHCVTVLLTWSLLYSSPTRNVCLVTHSTRQSIGSTHASIRLPLVVSVCPLVPSTRGTHLSTRSTRNTTCRSF